MTGAELDAIKEFISRADRPFWVEAEFWIFFVLGVAGLAVTALAYREAGRAKEAAQEAAKTVKLQSITIELTEVVQKLDALQPSVRFSEARDLLAEVSRRLRRAVSPYTRDRDLAEPIGELLNALASAKKALKDVRPVSPEREGEAPQAVYFGVEEEFSAVSDHVSDLLGLFETRSMPFGESHGDTT